MNTLRRAARLIIAVLLVSASTPLFATPARSPISLTLKLEGLEEGRLSGEAVLEVVSLLHAPDTTVTLVIPSGMEAERTEWTVDLQQNVPVLLTTRWSLSAGPGNYTVSAKATRLVGPKSSWGDMQSIPYHMESAGVPAEGWKVDRVPVGKMARAGTALVLSDEPIPFEFEDLSAISGADEKWPDTEARPPSGGKTAGYTDPSAGGPPAAAGTVTLTGTWKYPDRSGVARAVDQQYLEIRHGDGSPLSPRVFCFTQADGEFSCSFPHPGTTLRVWLRSATNLTPGPTRLGVFSGIEVPGGCGSDSIDCTYANSSPTISCPDGATCNLGVMVAAGGEPWIGAHQMTQDLIRSWKKILFDTKHPAGTHSGPAKITYPTPAGHGPHAHVFDNGSETTGDPWISIPAPFQTAADVVNHEYGHAVMDNLWQGYSPIWTQDDCPSPHYIGSPSGYGCGLSEGFADYWSWYSNEFYDGDSDSGNDGPIYDDPGFSVNFETRDDGTWASGPTVEGNVAGAFGDMMDAVTEGPPLCAGTGDRLADGIQHVWHVIYSDSYAGFSDWWTAYWSTYLHPRAPALEVLALNGIDFGFPTNDTCATAHDIAGFDFTDSVDTTLASCGDAGDPTPVCGNGSNGKNLFYHWTSPGPGTVTVDTFGSNYDTILSVWSGACGALASFACNDDSVGTQSKLVFGVTTGQDLTFMVSAFHDDGGDLSFHLKFQPLPAGNDACAGATVITAVPYSDAVDVSAATGDPGDPNHTCGFTGTTGSVFYKWVAPADGILRADTLGSNYDTVLSVFTGTCGALTSQACNDDTYLGLSEIALLVTAGTALTFMISDYGSAPNHILVFHLDFSATLPVHDTCAAAKVVSSFPYTDISNTYGATTSPGDPPPGCGNQSTGKNVWYQFTAPASGTITADTVGSSYDTILTAYTGACGALSEVWGGCNDDFQPPDRTSRVQIPVTAGTTYFFQASAYNSDGGTLAFHLDYAPNAPLNDPCGGATIVTGSPYQDVVYTVAATTAPGEPPSPCGNQSAAKSVWYRFTAMASGILFLQTYGSDYDTILSIWSGGCGALVPEGCNDDAPGSPQSSLTFPAGKGITYHIRIAAYNGDGGVSHFSLQFLPDSGHVPDGSLYPGQPLDVVTTPGGDVQLSWGPSCLPTDTDYAVYEGQLGSYYSHMPVLCSSGGAMSVSFRPAPFDTYYLVVPRNVWQEGSHGLTSWGAERPVGPSTCLGQSIGQCAPACSHDICAAGAALDPACNSCVAQICADDPACCSTGWSPDCAGNAQRSCPLECN